MKRKRGRPRKNPLPDNDSQDSITPVISVSHTSENATPKRRVGRPSKKEMMERAARLGVTVEELKYAMLNWYTMVEFALNGVLIDSFLVFLGICRTNQI